jgi:hypothetical protein
VRKRPAAFGDSPPLISWQPFCAEEDRTQGCAKRTAFGGDGFEVVLDFDLLPRPALAKKSMKDSDFNQGRAWRLYHLSNI